jgi:hypothetical protein
VGDVERGGVAWCDELHAVIQSAAHNANANALIGRLVDARTPPAMRTLSTTGSVADYSAHRDSTSPLV